MPPRPLSALQILCLTILLSACGDKEKILVPTTKVQFVSISKSLLADPWFPDEPKAGSQSRKSALGLELLDTALKACTIQVQTIRGEVEAQEREFSK